MKFLHQCFCIALSVFFVGILYGMSQKPKVPNNTTKQKCEPEVIVKEIKVPVEVVVVKEVPVPYEVKVKVVEERVVYREVGNPGLETRISLLGGYGPTGYLKRAKVGRAQSISTELGTVGAAQLQQDIYRDEDLSIHIQGQYHTNGTGMGGFGIGF